jgi:thiol-disulfide isomerase/thioredoxin
LATEPSRSGKQLFRGVPGTFRVVQATYASVAITIGSMNINRPRLLAASLAIAVVISGLGGYLLVQISADDDPSVDAVLTDSQDRDIPVGVSEIGTNDVLEGDPLPDAIISDRDGNDVTTASLLGAEPLVINFWFSSCPPCAAELPEFADSHAEFGDQVRFLGVNTIDSVPVMERFAAERGVTYEQFRDDLALFTDGIRAVNFPITIFVTSDGTIVEQTGVIDADGLREKITNLLAMEELI